MGTVVSASVKVPGTDQRGYARQNTPDIGAFEDGAVKTYTITATAGPGGSITPSGNVTVKEGESKTFTIKPDSGYVIEDVKVDYTSIGPKSSHTFTNVTADHVIHALFKKSSGGGTDPDKPEPDQPDPDKPNPGKPGTDKPGDGVDSAKSGGGCDAGIGGLTLALGVALLLKRRG